MEGANQAGAGGPGPYINNPYLLRVPRGPDWLSSADLAKPQSKDVVGLGFDRVVVSCLQLVGRQGNALKADLIRKVLQMSHMVVGDIREPMKPRSRRPKS